MGVVVSGYSDDTVCVTGDGVVVSSYSDKGVYVTGDIEKEFCFDNSFGRNYLALSNGVVLSFTYSYEGTLVIGCIIANNNVEFTIDENGNDEAHVSGNIRWALFGPYLARR